ncbi:flavodoxin family protein [Anaerovorax odorimutans]|uniref:Flavodoxin family protein n=1 Tax=Anaerovorax odorimutans TaxID=109327 RepID=A0ABT1RN02_9FIRM|nr:flavodoxin family protein [Anaerovorax odorimutans]MCQ4636568.1 flavodoxin family protein [Anaerovorax odorimutans]
MKIIAINGSPRENHNTGTLLKKALEGAASCGAETEFVNLYKLNYKGCVSCFACKLKDGESYGKCAYLDDLLPLLDWVAEADAIILGSPIYFASVTGEMRSFLERLLFSCLSYTKDRKSLFPKKLPVGFIYTMNVTEAQMEELGYRDSLRFAEASLEERFGYFEALYAYDTYQFDDYSKYVATAFDSEKKAKAREEEFPIYCQKAFDLGVKFASEKL